MQNHSSKRWPKITIVTPSYNQGRFIEKTIKSVLDQNYPNLEYWVIDGGSTDETISILKKYQNRISWLSEADSGQTHAINKGLKRSTGEILAYLNSDDVYEPNSLHIVANYFIKQPEAAVVCGKGKLIDENGQYMGDYHNAPMDFTRPQPTCSISQPAVFWKRKVMDAYGLFDESYQLAMDYEYWVRISKNFQFNYIDDYLATSRIHNSTKTSNDQLGVTKDVIKAQKKYYEKVHERWIINKAYLENKQLILRLLNLYYQNLKINHCFPSNNSVVALLNTFLRSKDVIIK